MDSSQDSAFSGRGHYMKDSIQLAAFRRTDSPSAASLASMASSTKSSIQEMSYLEERGLRRSFKAIQDERFARRNEDTADNPWTTNTSGFDTELDDLTEPKSVLNRTVTWDEEGMKTTSPLQLMHAQRDGDRDTPSSTGSASSTHMIWNKQNGKRRDFNPGNMQQNTAPKTFGVNPSVGNGHTLFDNVAPTNLATTTRQHLKDRVNTPDDDNMITKFGANPAVGNGHTAFDEDRPQRSQSEKGVRCLPRFIALIGLILVVVVGIIVIIYIAKEDRPDSQHGHKVADPIVEEKECLEVDILLGEEIKFRCTFKEEFEDVNTLRVRSPLHEDGDSIDINVNLDQSDWEAKYVKRDLELSITGPPTTCTSGGQYDLELINDDDESIHNTSVVLTVMSQLAKVNMSLDQQNRTDTNGTDTNSTDFTVGCHTNSGCERAFLDLFSVVNQQEQSLRNFDFSCTTSYTDKDGFSLGCQGTIPYHLLHDMGRIICRPSSSLLANVSLEDQKQYEEHYDLPECDITQNCGFKCVEEMDFYYAVNPERCDIFHRCVDQRVYTEFCGDGTFFNPAKCACDHITFNPYWCQKDGAVRQNQIGNLEKTWCRAGNKTESSTD